MSLFPSHYYQITVSNSKQRKSRWFCNKPLSPQANTENNNLCQLKLTDYTYENTNPLKNNDSIVMQDDMNSSKTDELVSKAHYNISYPDRLESRSFAKNMNCGDTACSSNIITSDDSDMDPDFIPSSSEASEIEFTSDDNYFEQILRDKKSTTCTDKPQTECSRELFYERRKQNGEIRKGKKKMDFCYYCESPVLNFARHVQRNHSLEIEVQKLISLPPSNSERRKLLQLLRNKGNYLNSNESYKAVKKPVSNGDLLPCSNCLGFYSSNQLWRHRKKCLPGNDKNHKSAAQDLLLNTLSIDPQLRERVFPKMRADEISLLAKKDPLICAFGARYIKIHREKHFINVASRKMRELSRLLQEMKKIKPNIKTLFEALKPINFDLLIAATKNVAKYDSEKDIYGAPTFAMNIGTALKQCCSIAITYALKRKNVFGSIPAAEAEADLQSLIQLIETQWRFEISSQAANDLNINRWNKVTMVPLASDLKVFKDYLIQKAFLAISTLSNDESNISSYIVLLETIYCRVLLLNRRRPGELQRLLLDTYLKTEGNTQNYEEFTEVVTPSEKILLQKFKRVVIRGKRGRGVPVLFSLQVQEHINILLKYRNSFFRKTNLYLFGNPNTTQPICGYKILKKHAKASGAKNPQSISSTRLRKHLATLTQVFSMTENDIEQLAAFMGHTVGVHKGSYRLPNDIYQTAKISKLLLLMEKGEAAEHKGKSINEIELDLEEDLLDPEKQHMSDNDDDNNHIAPLLKEISEENDSNNQNSEEKEKCKRHRKRILVPWTKEQKNVVEKFFADHIKKKRPPKKDECLMVKERHSQLLTNKDWVKIKVYIQNVYSGKLKTKHLV